MPRRLLAALIVSALATVGRAADEPDPVAVLKRHVAAVGGAELLAKYSCRTLKMTGTATLDGVAVPIEVTSTGVPPDRSRTVWREGGDAPTTVVVNGDKGFTRAGDGPAKALTAAELAREQESLYASAVTRVAPVLADPKFRLAHVGREERDGRTEVGVRVDYPGRPSLTLWFDAETHRLARSVGPGVPPVKVQEDRLGDYKPFAGILYPTRWRVYRDGVLYLDDAIREVTFAAVDDKLFAGGVPAVGAAEAECVAVLKRHVAAAGGAERLAKVKSVAVRSAGTMATGRWAFDVFGVRFWLKLHAPGGAAVTRMAPIEVAFAFAPERFRVGIAYPPAPGEVMVLGQDGSAYRNGKEAARPMTIAELMLAQAAVHSRSVELVAPVLADPKFQLTPLGSAIRDGRVEHGVRVEHQDRPGAEDLWFDAETHLLVGMTSPDLTTEVRYTDYKEFGGVKYPTRHRRTANGKSVSDLTVTEAWFAEVVDEATFAKP